MCQVVAGKGKAAMAAFPPPATTYFAGSFAGHIADIAAPKCRFLAGKIWCHGRALAPRAYRARPRHAVVIFRRSSRTCPCPRHGVSFPAAERRAQRLLTARIT